MAKTLSDILTSVAYRMAEDSTPSDSSEEARRIRYVNEGLRKIVSRHPFWWTEASATESTVADQETYSLPSDFRDMIEVRISDKLYTAIPRSKVLGLYDDTIKLFNYDDIITNKHYYIYADTLYIIPTPSASTADAIEMKYYKYPTAVSNDSDTFDMPDLYTESLVAYAFARLSQLDGRRGDAADAMAEFEEIVREMVAEENRRRFYGKSARVITPNYKTM